jgi:putative ABC transport system permease protein
MRALDRKVLRDLRSMRGQMVAIGLVLVSGVAMFVSARSLMHALERSLDGYYREYRFADGFASVRRAPERVRASLQEVPGVAQVETRVTAPATLEIPGFDEPVSGQLLSVPEGEQPQMNRLYLRRGRLVRLGRVDEVLLNEAFAQAHELGPGDEIGAIINGRRRTLTVVGIALSPEFLLQIQPGSVFPDPERYGVLWMGRDALAAAFDMTGAFNDVAFTLAPGARIDDVTDGVDRVLEPYGGTGALPRKDQLSNWAISEEFKQLRSTSTVLPMIFIAVAAFLLNVVVGRLISLQREQIGVLKAFGYRNVDVGAHYLKLVLVVCVIGAAGGGALGLWLGRLLGRLYLMYYHFPSLDYSTSLLTVVNAALLTMGAVVVGTLQAVRRAVRLAPAVAMRPPSPATYHATLMERLGLKRFLDQPTRMIVRNVERRPARTLLTIAGIASSCAILIMGAFFNDSFAYVIRVQYGLAERGTYTVTFSDPTSRSAIQELASLDGVRYAEPFRSVPVKLSHHNRRYDTALQGVPRPAYLRRIIDRDLQAVSIPPDGVVLTERLAEILGVRPGDQVVVDVREGQRRKRTETVAGLTSQFIGVGAYMDIDALNRLAGNGDAVSGAYLMTDARDDARITGALERRPRVAAIVSQQRAIAAARESYDRSMLTFTFILTAFAGVIAFGVVYNSARIALSERDRELASLRVLGFTRGEISYILLGELGLLTLAALPLGFALGALAAAGIAEATQTDLYQFPLVLGRRTFGLAAAVVLASAAASALAVRRKLNRLDLVGVLKTRE